VVALLSCVVKSLVLQFYTIDFLLDFHLPLTIFNLSSLVVFILEFTNFVKLLLLLDFQGSLVNRLGKKNIQNRLDFLVIIEEVVVLNLSDFIYSSLLWDVWRSWGFRLELVSLQFHFCLSWLCLSLLGQEVG
jgi:hypothetical protein